MYIALRNILILFMLLALFGCGWDMAKSDPWGKDTVSITAVPESLQAGQSSIITATVNNAEGKAVQERTVTFTLYKNNSGGTLNGTLSILNVETGGDGKAVASYTAGGASPENDVEDIIRVRLDNGATAVVVITRSGTGIFVTLEANPATLTANQNSIVTAKVIDRAGNPVSGETVFFSIPVKNSGSPQFTAYSGVSDSNGIVTTIYTPGTASPNDTVNDTIQASLTNGSNRAVVITRTAGTMNVIVTLGATPATLTANQSSIVTATVADNTGKPVSGETVFFSIPVKNSGTPQLTAYSGISDGNGIVTTIYSPGTASPTSTVYDTIQAILANGSSRAVVITRTAGTIPTGAEISLSASPTTLNGGQTSIITAKVTGGTNAGVNEAVTLTIPVNNSGANFINAAGASVSTLTITTGSSGTATAIYRAGAGSSGTSVQDTVAGVVLSSGAFNAVTITRSAGVAGYIVTVTANPSIIVVTAPGSHTGVSLITANVKTSNGTMIPNATVLFAVAPSGGLGTVTSPATTDGNGNAIATYTSAHLTPTADVVTATTTIGGNIYIGAVTITVP
jgi:adhesin/invasin